MGYRINSEAFEREPAPPKSRPKKRSAYLAFLHRLPCVVTGRYGVEAAHVSYASIMHGHFGRGKQTKAPDRFALPLCPEEHALQHSGKLGTEREFWSAKGINPHELANTLWGLFCDFDEEEAVIRCTHRINQGLAIAGRLPSKDLA